MSDEQRNYFDAIIGIALTTGHTEDSGYYKIAKAAHNAAVIKCAGSATANMEMVPTEPDGEPGGQAIVDKDSILQNLIP